jgi:hypothetical protein
MILFRDLIFVENLAVQQNGFYFPGSHGARVVYLQVELQV